MLRPAVLLLLFGTACGQHRDDAPPPTTNGPLEWDELDCAWEDRAYGGAVDIAGAGLVAFASDGDLVVGGSVNHTPADYAIWLRRYSATGTIEWAVEEPPDGTIPGRSALALDDQDRIGVTGMVGSGAPDYSMHLWAAKTRPTGEQAWLFDLGIESDGSDVCFAPTGEMYVAGNLRDDEHPATGTFLWVGKLAADGTVLWTHLEAGQRGERNEGRRLVCDSSGDVVVLGSMIDGAGHSSSWIRRYDPAGNEVWTTTITDPQGASPEQMLLDATAGDLLVSAQLVDRKHLYRVALADGAISDDMPAPEQPILAADAGGVFVDGNFYVKVDPACDDQEENCDYDDYWGYAYFDWDAELMWWRAATAGVPDEGGFNAMSSLAIGDGGAVALVGTIDSDIWICYQ